MIPPAVIFCLCLLLITMVSAEFTINSFGPLQAGQEKTITWSYDGTPALTKINIDLVTGSQNNLKPILSVAKDIDPTALSFVWKVPADLPQREDYALKVTGDSMLRFNARFAILGGPSASPATSASSTPTPTNGSVGVTSGAAVTSFLFSIMAIPFLLFMMH